MCYLKKQGSKKKVHGFLHRFIKARKGGAVPKIFVRETQGTRIFKINRMGGREMKEGKKGRATFSKGDALYTLSVRGGSSARWGDLKGCKKRCKTGVQNVRLLTSVTANYRERSAEGL